MATVKLNKRIVYKDVTLTLTIKEAVAICAMAGRTSGNVLYDLYDKLDVMFGDTNEIPIRILGNNCRIETDDKLICQVADEIEANLQKGE